MLLRILFLIVSCTLPAGYVWSQNHLSQKQFITGCAAYRESVIESIIQTLGELHEVSDSLKILSPHPEVHDQFLRNFLYMVMNERYWDVSDMIEKSFGGDEPASLKAYRNWGHKNMFKLHEINVLASNRIIEDKKPFKLGDLTDFWKEISFYNLAEGDIILDMGAGNGFMSFILSLTGFPLEIYASEIDPGFRKSIMDKNQLLSSLPKGNSVTVVEARERDLGLDSVMLDKIIMKEVFHHLDFPKDILAAVQRNLKDDGSLILVEGTRDLPAPKGSRCPKATTKKRIVKTLNKAGFQLTDELTSRYDHLLKFQKMK